MSGNRVHRVIGLLRYWVIAFKPYNPTTQKPYNPKTLQPYNRSGAILFGVLIVVLTVSLIGASLVALLSSLALTNQYEVNRAKALYLAEAGISQAVYLLKNQAIMVENQEFFVSPTHLGDGTYEVKLDYRQSLMSSTGRVGGIKREIQLKYSPF